MIWFLQNMKNAYKLTTGKKLKLHYLLIENRLEKVD